MCYTILKKTDAHVVILPRGTGLSTLQNKEDPMLFNMEMISYFLSDFDMNLEFIEDKWQINSFIVGDETDDLSVLRIFSDNSNVICKNEENRITVFGAELKDVVNVVARRINFYNDWERRALVAVATGRQLSDYLSLLSELFPGYTVKFLDALGRIHHSTDKSEILPKPMDPLYMTLIRNIPACHRISLGINGVTSFWSSHFQRQYLYGNFVFPDSSFIIFSIFAAHDDVEPIGNLQIHLGQFAQSIFQRANVSRLDQPGLMTNRNFIMHLLDGQEISGQDVQDFETVLGWSVSDGAYFVLIENRPNDSFAVRALPYTISTRLPLSFPFNYNDTIVCLIPDCDFKHSCNTLKDLLTPIGFSGGISLPFSTWDQIPSAYFQARISLAHKSNAGASLLACYDYLWDWYIERFKSDGCSDLRHPAIDALLRSQNGGRQLLDTFYCYLRHNCSLAAAASALDIHINTLKYRMNKIRDIVDLEPDDYEGRMAFLVSYDIEHKQNVGK